MSTRTVRDVFVVTDELKNRFFSKTVSASTGCMLWTGAIQRNGYGAFKLNGKKIDAHVASWRISHNGFPVPIGNLVMHSCDCRTCVNPEHLQLGTTSENMTHAHRDGRMLGINASGENCYNAVLNDALVRAIRIIAALSNKGYRTIAKDLGVSEHAVRRVCDGTGWKHVTTEGCHNVS